MSDEQKPVLTIEKIYVKDLSVEVPHAPGIFLERDAPEVHLELNAKNQEVGDELYEVILTATLTAKLKEQVMFLVEVQQAGVFRIRHVSQENMGPVLAIGCANIIFPYLRETVSDAVTRAGFTAVILSPVNFETIYQQQQQQKTENNSKATSSE